MSTPRRKWILTAWECYAQQRCRARISNSTLHDTMYAVAYGSLMSINLYQLKDPRRIEHIVDHTSRVYNPFVCFNQ